MLADGGLCPLAPSLHSVTMDLAEQSFLLWGLKRAGIWAEGQCKHEGSPDEDHFMARQGRRQ